MSIDVITYLTLNAVYVNIVFKTFPEIQYIYLGRGDANYQRSIEPSSNEFDPTTFDRCVNGARLQFDRQLSIFNDMDHGGGNDSDDDDDDDDVDVDDDNDDDHDDKNSAEEITANLYREDKTTDYVIMYTSIEMKYALTYSVKNVEGYYLM
jgi:hypothetical protein